MDASKIDMFFAANGEKLPSDKKLIIREKMKAVDDSRYAIISSIELKNPTTMLLISLFVGELGVDCFMLGKVGKGVLKLLTIGLFGILWLIDILTVQGQTKEYNFNELMKVL